MDTKAIIKINGRYCEQEEINRIALVALVAPIHTRLTAKKIPVA